MSVNAGMAVLACLGALAMRVILLRANKKIMSGAVLEKVMGGAADAEIAGLSAEEREARKQEFRYIA
jgi:hypothetical protein